MKIGRTHLQDATPLTLGQEISGWAAMLTHNRRHLEAALPHLCELALGEGSLVVNSSQGGGIKDTWVVESLHS